MRWAEKMRAELRRKGESGRGRHAVTQQDQLNAQDPVIQADDTRLPAGDQPAHDESRPEKRHHPTENGVPRKSR